jgi:RNA polymerase sigma-70 factor, ECF subfamily
LNDLFVIKRGNLDSSGERKRQIGYRDFKDRDFLFETVRQCRDGNTEAMESIYTAYKSSLFHLTYRFAGESSAAEDLLQDIFIKIFTNIKRLRSPEAFNSWIYRIAANTCMSFARMKKKKKEVPLQEIESTGHHEDLESTTNQQLEQAIKSLPPKQKTVFQLHDVEGFTHAEIAEIMKISEGAAKSQLFKARMKIRDYLRSE